MAAARKQFLAHGFQHLSVDGLARASGVSKETIYRHFPDKAAIFRAAVEGLDEPFKRRLPTLDPHGDPLAVLADCAQAIHDAAVDADSFSYMWITIAVARDFPDLARSLNAQGFEDMEPIRAYLNILAKSRGRADDVPIEAVAKLGALAIQGPRYLMGWPALAASERMTAANRTARLFLEGCLKTDRIVDLADGSPAPLPSPQRLGPHLETLLDEARRQFYARGFRQANLDEIGAAARAGRGTLYRHFKSKAGLFEAAMLQSADRLAASAASLPVSGDLALRLDGAARVAASTLCSTEGVQLYRTVIGEARRAPAVARAVYSRSRDPFTATVESWLRAAQAQGAIDLEDPAWAARQFLTLATGGNRALTSDAFVRDLNPSRLAASAVETFLYGFLESRRAHPMSPSSV